MPFIITHSIHNISPLHETQIVTVSLSLSSHAFQIAPSQYVRTTKQQQLRRSSTTIITRSSSRDGDNDSSDNDNSSDNDISNSNNGNKLYFDIAIAPSPTELIPLGRLTFQITPPAHPAYLPLHTSNLLSLASELRSSVDPKCTYRNCVFQYSPSTIDDGSARYRWGHVCEGHGRNGIRTRDAGTGRERGWEDAFSDPERVKECAHTCFGGVYYGMSYDEIISDREKKKEGESDDEDDAAVLLTVPIHGPGAGTSKFSIVRVEESPREWGERLLENSAVVGYLDCGADGTFVGDDDDDDDDDESVEGEDGGPRPTSLDVLRAMARQRVGPPKIVHCGVE
eukprot:CAMPEP_0196133296 /NCGR_PEP_ID=MMETSP0910-20130528/2576_1 /TAXON_ID=49265 /ORGANISM="Thalassiosira rotula, Strain GSO102" /LENGTH=338 /DNA_ID=CAMNT_0041393007 /DNA_START=36 /DNA_END=1053 /DNA_ORIENTATION=-